MLESNVKLFIFTCVRDGTKFLPRLFDSLINQTNHNFVHYIYDDGSIDDIDKLIIEYKDKVNQLENPFKIYFEKGLVNNGLLFSTQYCISKVDKPYFMWINCDDWLDSNCVEESLKYINNNPSYFIYRLNNIHCKTYNEKGKTTYDKYNKKRLLSKNQLYYKYLGNWEGNHFIVNTSIYFELNPKNNFILKKSFFNDEQLYFIGLLNRQKMPFIKSVVTYFLERNDSECHKYKPNTIDFTIDNINNLAILINSPKKLTKKVIKVVKAGFYLDAFLTSYERHQFKFKKNALYYLLKPKIFFHCSHPFKILAKIILSFMHF